MKRSIKIGLIISLVVFFILNIGGYVLLSYKLVRTKTELKESRVLVYQALKENQLLRDELKLSKDELNQTKDQLNEIKIALENTQNELNLVKDRLTNIEERNLLLLEEKERLQVRLHSLKKLKEAIRQVKLDAYQERIKQDILKKKIQAEIDAQRLALGNRGYLIKDGQSLYHLTKIKIEVKSVD